MNKIVNSILKFFILIFLISDFNNLKFLDLDNSKIFFLLPVKKLSMQITFCLCSINILHKFEPINPAPPDNLVIFFIIKIHSKNLGCQYFLRKFIINLMLNKINEIKNILIN